MRIINDPIRQLPFDGSYKRGNNKKNNKPYDHILSIRVAQLGNGTNYGYNSPPFYPFIIHQNNFSNDTVCNQFLTLLPVHFVQFHSHNIILIEIHPEGTLSYTHGDNQRDVMRYLRCLMEWNIIILFVMKFLEFSLCLSVSVGWMDLCGI